MLISKKIILAVMLSTTALASGASAVDEKFFIQANVGVGFAADTKLTTENTPGYYTYFQDQTTKMGQSGVFGIEAGAKLNESIRLSASFDYLPGIKGKESLSSTSTTSFKVKSYVAMANIYWDVANLNGITPYFMGGVGYAKNTMHDFQVTNGKLFSSANKLIYTGTYSSSNGTKNNFAWKLGLGAKYDINDSFAVDLRYQYMGLGKFESGNTFNAGGQSATALKTVKGNLNVNEILVGVAYKF